MSTMPFSEKVDLVKRAIREVCDRINSALGREDTVFAQVIGFLVSKTVTSFRAVECLWKEGLGGDAQVIVRSIFENAVNLRYISQSPDERSDRFMRYLYVEHYNALKVLKSIGLKSAISPEDEKKISDGYREYLAKYTDKQVSRWSGQRLRIMAKECGLARLYDLYGRMSAFVHPSPWPAGSYLRAGNEALREWADVALMGAGSLTLMVLEDACAALGIKLPPAFVNAKQAFTGDCIDSACTKKRRRS